jgi:hypothetical protein
MLKGVVQFWLSGYPLDKKGPEPSIFRENLLPVGIFCFTKSSFSAILSE